MNGLKTNQRLELAYSYLMYTGENVFLTGKAGTGKTTFLKQLRQLSPKRMVVAAPTGVAAINAGGVTLHSLFQLSFGPQIPGQYKPSNQFTRTKLDLIRSIDLLVIDEISMVRADLLDAVDGVLRRIRRNSKPFGGVQLLLIGDMQQLAPVVTRQEESILKDYYSTFYFFGSLAWQKTKYVGIELNEIFRQTDNEYVSILNAIRDGSATMETVNNLNKRYIPCYVPPDEDNVITLVTHNAMAEKINSSHMAALPGEEKTFTAEIKGDFPESSYPAEKNLVLKIGAAVMFIKNDPSYQKLFFNGKIGRITSFDDDGVVVKCNNDDNEIHVTPLPWENKKYTIDDNTKEITENTVGTFTQLPLRTAWAVTIHKSQGLTFDKMMLDVSRSFTHGQAYVALSRCRTLDGLVLLQPFSASDIICDPTIRQFSQTVEQNVPSMENLVDDKRNYFFSCIDDLFNFNILYSEIQHLVRKFAEAKTAAGNIEIFNNTDSKIYQEMIAVAEKFSNTIKNNFSKCSDPENEPTLNSRITKGCEYFLSKLSEIVENPTTHFIFDCDDKEKKKNITEAVENLKTEYNFRVNCLSANKAGFNIKNYLSTKAKLKLSQSQTNTKQTHRTASNAVDTKTSSQNSGLFTLLNNWRQKRAGELGIEPKEIVKTTVLKQIADSAAQSYLEISKIKGMGAAKTKKLIPEILELILNYRKDNGMTADFSELKTARYESLSSQEQSLYLFSKVGLTLEEIVKKRKIALTTVINHLIKYVATGEVPATKLIDSQRLEEIKKFIVEHQNINSLTEVYEGLNQKYTYDEIRVAKADIDFEKL